VEEDHPYLPLGHRSFEIEEEHSHIAKEGRTKKEQVQRLVGGHTARVEGLVVAVADHRACSVAGLGTMDSCQDEAAEEVVEEGLPFHPSEETADTMVDVAHRVDSPCKVAVVAAAVSCSVELWLDQIASVGFDTNRCGPEFYHDDDFGPDVCSSLACSCSHED